MREIRIVSVDNGFVIYVTKQGNQSLNEKNEVFIAKNKEEIFDILEKEI
jgi:hypothetical protein